MIVAWVGIVIAGIMGGSWAVPSKRIRHLSWDQTWLIYCIIALVVLPVCLALVAAPVLFQKVFPENARAVLVIALCGVSFGAGSALYGASIPRLGFALSNAIVCGTVTLLGSLGPLIVGGAAIGTGEGGRLAFGLSLLLAGIGVSTLASVLRDQGAGATGSVRPSLASSLIGVAIAILSGCLSAMLNTGFAYGGRLIEKATALGIAPVAASMAVWVPALFGGFLVNLVVVAFKISRAKQWGNFREAPATDWLRAASLGFLWFGNVVIYSISAAALGSAGAVYGFAVTGGVAILASSAWGFGTGEWKHAGLAARLWALGSVVLFLFAFATLASTKEL